MKAVLVVVDSSVKVLEHNLKVCNVNDITYAVATLADIEGLSATMLKSHEFDVAILHSKELELEETEFGKMITNKKGTFDLSLAKDAAEKATEYFTVWG